MTCLSAYIPCLRNIFNFRCQITSVYIQSMQFPFITYGIYGAIYKRQYTDKHKHWVNVCVCKRASLDNFFLTFLNCYFFQYFVGTSDTLSVQMTCLSAYMYWQIFKCTDKTPKKYYGPGPPLLATLMFPVLKILVAWSYTLSRSDEA